MFDLYHPNKNSDQSIVSNKCGATSAVLSHKVSWTVSGQKLVVGKAEHLKVTEWFFGCPDSLLTRLRSVSTTLVKSMAEY